MILAAGLLVALGALAIALLALRVTLHVAVERRELLRVRGEARLFGGFVRLRFGEAKPSHPSRPRPEPDGSPQRARRRRAFSPALLLDADFGALRRPLGRFFTRLRTAVRLRQFAGSFRVGLDDPADTGRLWAVLGPAVIVAARVLPNLRVDMDFERPRVDFEGYAHVVFVPLELVFIVLALVLSPPVLRAAWLMRSAA